MVSLFVMSSCEKDDVSKSISIVDLTCNVTVKNVTTHGGEDGEITVTVITGNGEYDYYNNNRLDVNRDGKFENLTVGTYQIKVIDSEDKEFTKSVTITEPGVVVVSPTVNTLSSTNITQTTVTLNGKVNANGFTTTLVKFEYGVNSYDNSVTLNNISGNTLTDVSTNISGLTSNTTYHYRLVATNEGGTTTSDDMTFTTKSYNIGDELYGGIIFKLPNTNVYPNEPGLIVKETDLYSSPNYYPGDNTVITINNKDWRLPEYNELLLMYNTVNSSLTNPLRTDGFLYWTKTKDPNNSSKRQIFNPNNTSSIIYYSTTGTTELIRLVTTF